MDSKYSPRKRCLELVRIEEPARIMVCVCVCVRVCVQSYLFRTLTTCGLLASTVGKLLDKFWTRIVVEVLSLNELRLVLLQSFPALTPLVHLFLDTFAVLQMHDTHSTSAGQSSSRHFSTRYVRGGVCRRFRVCCSITHRY
jgi:hypothetical protein